MNKNEIQNMEIFNNSLKIIKPIYVGKKIARKYGKNLLICLILRNSERCVGKYEQFKNILFSTISTLAAYFDI